MFTHRKTLLSLAAVALLSFGVAVIQPSAAPNQPVSGPPINVDIGAVITNTTQAAATVTGVPTRNNLQWKGVTCAFLGTASSGSGTETWSIEGYDAATDSWYQIATTGSLAFNPYTTFTIKTLTVYPGVAVSSLSSPNAAQSAVLPLTWRLKDVIASVSGGPRITSKGGCNYIVP